MTGTCVIENRCEVALIARKLHVTTGNFKRGGETRLTRTNDVNVEKSVGEYMYIMMKTFNMFFFLRGTKLDVNMTRENNQYITI